MLRNVRHDRRETQEKNSNYEVSINMPPLSDHETKWRVHHRYLNRLKKYLARLFRINKWIVIIFTMKIFFGLIFSIYYGLTIINQYNVELSPKQINICYSKPCRDSTEFILTALNRSVDPCNDFYNFVCGNYMISKDNLVSKDIAEKLISVMESYTPIKTQDFGYLAKLQRYYKTCVDKFFIYNQDLFKKFEELDGWPVVNKQKWWFKKKLEWTNIVHKFYNAGLKTDFLIDIQFVIDSRNRSKKIMVMNVPDLNSKTPKIDKKSIINMVKILELNSDEQDVEKMIDLERELESISSDLQVEKFDTIENLQSKFPRVKWLEFLIGFLSPDAKISAKDEVTYYTPYLERFYNLIAKRKPPIRILVNYFFWKNVFNLEYKFLINPMFMNFDNFEVIFEVVNSKERRKMICVKKMYDDMYLATSALFAKHILDRKNMKAAQFVIEKIRQSLYQNVKKVDWLSEEAKRKVLNKISRIEALIGHPPELLNETILNDYYRDLEVSSDQFFINHWNFQKFQRRKDAQEFARPVDVKHWMGQFGRATKILAVYMAQNVIIIAGGMMHKLFIDGDIPHYMNYGSFGAIVGHEMSHALGDYYLNLDANDNYVEDLWDEISNKKLTNKYKCLVEKYSNYTYPEHDLYIDGNSTLEENVAHITGLKATYDAYVSLTIGETEEPHLPGLEDFNAKQMFWIAYGSTFCTEIQIKNETEIEIKTEYTPENIRVNGAVSNFPEFAKDFNCKPTDSMNPIEKCPIWY